MAKSIRRWTDDYFKLLEDKGEWDELFLGEELDRMGVLSEVVQKSYKVYLAACAPGTPGIDLKLAESILYTLAASKKLGIDIVQAITDRWNEAKLSK